MSRKVNFQKLKYSEIKNMLTKIKKLNRKLECKTKEIS